MFPPFSDLQAGKLVFVQTVRLVVYLVSCISARVKLGSTLFAVSERRFRRIELGVKVEVTNTNVPCKPYVTKTLSGGR
jgi:hypothetical protein